MNPHVREIFTQAAVLRPEDREAYFAEACGEDAELRLEVQRLLVDAERADSFFGDEAEAATVAADGSGQPSGRKAAPPSTPNPRQAEPVTEKGGDWVGPYKLREQIGEGGFGTVWVAEQEKPVRRRVALKIVKLGMDTKDVIARFEQERQALALMDHPNIAKVLDAGASDNGRPYFVMELVRGVKITEYCDEKELTTRERLELFISVCQAVQHAHQKGLIHRDLKPSNILVTMHDGNPLVKVIDFGVAKATQGRMSEHTIYTQFQQMIGTPLYMSPEQADMTSQDVDTRSDIYSLGVLLYEMLTGGTPIDASTMREAGLDEMRRIIREVDPLRPSMRLRTLDGATLSTTAKRRHMEPASLPGSLRGDLDWIVMKCLEKDRTRRYDTANGLALDLQRHLDNEVVVARPPTTTYLLGKLIRRNRVAFAAGTAIAASLVIGIAASVWQAVRATRAEKEAVTAFDELRATAPAFAEQARGLAAREQYADAIDKLDYAIKLQPGSADFLLAKADLLQCQLKLTEAAAVYREALRVQPGFARAEASARLCDELLAAKPDADGRLSRESLAKLHLAMQQQQRPAAELLPVARLLGDEQKLLVEYWLGRLKDLPVSAERPLEDRLTVRDDGRLALDLSNTKVNDLSPLANAPLATLDLDGATELADLSPLSGLALVELQIDNTRVTDLTPLRNMRSLEKLTANNTRVADLAPLGDLRLKRLSIAGTRVADLTPIRKMPLEYLYLRETRVTDISPLAGMPVKTLYLDRTPVSDFSPLAGTPLERCYLSGTQITDLRVLRGTPLRELSLTSCPQARHYAVLSDIPTLESLLLPTTYRELPDEDLEAIGALRNHSGLRQIQSDYSGSLYYTATQPKDDFWKDWDTEQSFVSKLRKSGFTFYLKKLSTGTYSLGISGQPFHDLSILKGAPISELYLTGCQVSDLSPISGIPLESLDLGSNPVADLSPLKGLQLKSLVLRNTRVSDLSPLLGMPLERLYLDRCKGITDVAALGEIPSLEYLTVPTTARNIELLRKLPKLKRLAFHILDAAPWPPAATVEEFWKEWASMAWMEALNNTGADYTAAVITKKVPWIAKRDEKGRMTKAKPSKWSGASTGFWSIAINSKDFTDCSMFKDATNIGELNLSWSGVADLRPLEGLPLTKLDLRGTKVTDLQPLHGMKLTQLSLDHTEVTDLSPLAESATLTMLILPPKAKDIEFLRGLPKLERVSFAYDRKTFLPNQTPAEFWEEYKTQGWLRTLRASGLAIKFAKQLEDGTWNLNLEGAAITDLAVLRGAPISILNINKTAVADLAPLSGMALKELSVGETNVTDLGPLEGLPLTKLEIMNTGVTDLRPLEGLSLTKLYLRGTKVTDLGALRAPALSSSLRDLNISQLHIADFSPLGDCINLEELRAYATDLADLSVVRNCKLRVARLGDTRITDISALSGMPLEMVQLNYTDVTDISPLLQCPRLKQVLLPPKARDINSLRSLPDLVEISFTGNRDGLPDQKAPDFWKIYESQEWLTALKESGVKVSKAMQLKDGTWEVSINAPEFKDLSLLRGTPISKLRLTKSGVVDLTPLRGMALTGLHLGETKVADLGPLQGMPLEELALTKTSVNDLRPLEGAPLTRLFINGTAVDSIEPLRGMPLQRLFMGQTLISDLSPLHGMPLVTLKLTG